jgi:hypothetical protein
LSIEADSAWTGELRLDVPRHRTILGLPGDWPRINSYPEWFTVEPTRRYLVLYADDKSSAAYSGAELARGLPVRLRAGTRLRLRLRAGTRLRLRVRDAGRG